MTSQRQRKLIRKLPRIRGNDIIFKDKPIGAMSDHDQDNRSKYEKDNYKLLYYGMAKMICLFGLF